MSNGPPPRIEFEKEFSEKITVHKNLGQEVVVTTVDKVRLCLLENQECMGAKRQWVAPLGLFLTLATTLIAADFGSTFLLDAAVWEAVYVIGAAGSAIWLVQSAWAAWRSRQLGGVDYVVGELKAQSVETIEQVDDVVEEHVVAH